MEIRLSRKSEIDTLVEVYDHARSYMRQNGNLYQWTNGYPSRELILDDIAKGNSYVVEENGRVLCVFAYLEGEDPTYRLIVDGAWQNDRPYGVIHRIATDVHGKGVADFVYDWALHRCHNLKIDTHKDNIPMQKSLLKNGFVRCGIIFLANGEKRIAFQKEDLCKPSY